MFKLPEHETQLNQLLELTKVEGIDQGKISTIVQSLRDNYTEVNTSIEGFTKDVANTKSLNDSLLTANQFLIAKLGQPIVPKPNEPKPNEPKPSDVKSLDDIALELMK